MSFIIRQMKNVGEAELECNEVLLDSMMFRLIQISENAKKLSANFRVVDHPSIPWINLNGLRNRIVHDCGNVDLGIIFDTLKYSIPELYDQLNKELS